MLVPCPSFTPDITKIYEDTEMTNKLESLVESCT